VTVAEVTYSNSISVAEHVVMMILGLVRNYIPSHEWAVKGGWNIADCVERSYDLEGMAVGTVAAGRIGLAVLKRLAPFDVQLHYTDHHRLDESVERELGLTFHPDAAAMVPFCDVVTINAPLHPETEHLFDDTMFSLMKRGAYLVNTARGKICDRDAVVRALESGQLAGYAGDVWYPQPAPVDHPWRTMPHEGMTPHISGTSLSAQARYAAGTSSTEVIWPGPVPTPTRQDQPTRSDVLPSGLGGARPHGRPATRPLLRLTHNLLRLHRCCENYNVSLVDWGYWSLIYQPRQTAMFEPPTSACA
jgi:formate dehydrogenase